MNPQKNIGPKCFFVQANADDAYLLFPHQTLKLDSLHLPPFCLQNGHPTRKPVLWEVLSKHPETFHAGDRVILYQAGNPKWLRGFWGYGTILKRGNNVKIDSKKLLATPLILNDAARKSLRTPILKKVLGLKKGGATSYQSTYAKISESDFKTLADLMEQREENKSRYQARTKQAQSISAPKAKDAFEKWARKKGWEVIDSGYPDLLAEFPNGRIAAFEAKSGVNEQLRDSQKKTFEILKRIGLSISVLKDTRNNTVGKGIRRHHWTVIAEGEGPITKGWPDFLLQKGRRIVAVELKTGWRERLSEMQVKTLSSLSSQLGVEVHVVRATKENERGPWNLHDDSERWLLYPPYTDHKLNIGINS